MNPILEEKCRLFITNKESIEKKFKWDSSYVIPICGMLFTERNVSVDIDKMTQCSEMLKKKTGVFSNFQGNSRLVIVAKMALSDNPSAYLDKVMTAYDMLKKAKLSASEYTVLAATIIADNAEITDPKPVVEKTASIYRKMQQNHPLLTCSEDIAFAVLLAMDEIPEDIALQEMEQCYKRLTSAFLSANAVQSISHILALDTKETETKCQAVIEVRDMLKQRGKKYDSTALSILGGLISLDADRQVIVSDIVEVDEYLKKQKGFSFWGIGDYMRLLFATALVINYYEANNQTLAGVNNSVSAINSSIAAINSSVAAMMAMQMAMFSIVIASSASH